MTTIITVDYEHNCETWWDAARAEAKGNPPLSCVGLLDDVDRLEVSDEDADAFIGWASAIAGWTEQPFVIQTDGDLVLGTEDRMFRDDDGQWYWQARGSRDKYGPFPTLTACRLDYQES